VLKQAFQYLQGQIMLNERGNMTNIEKVVPDCNHHRMSVWLERPEVGVPTRKGERGRHPTRERVIGENPVEVWKLAEELPEDAWDNIFLRDSERKEIWCDMACLRIHQVRDGLPGPESWLIIRKDENGKKKYQFSNASPDTKMNRLAEMLAAATG